MIIVDGKQITWHQGMTLDQVIAGLEENQIFPVVRLNGKPISRPHFSGTSVADGDVIEPIPLIAGG
jgi:thiamine biosynthesis protein ThiS